MTRSRAWTTAILLVGVFLLVVAVSTLQQATQPSVPPGATQASVLPGNEVSWIQGVVTVGPSCPSPSVRASPCPSRPLAGAVIVQRFPNGGEATTTSQQDGSYQFVQPGGGTFTISGEPVQGTATPRPVTITVASGSGAHVDLRYAALQPSPRANAPSGWQIVARLAP